VVLEAMAAGTPIVATTVGGVPDMLCHEVSALLVSPRDSEALAQAIGRLLGDRDLAARLSERARGVVAQRFLPENYQRSLVAIYKDFLGN
jgi:glycosyltransferase involved in cell wall biosynthesis